MSRWRDRFDKERDRRYAEVQSEREKALKIKEEADRMALGLAREIQIYKDEKANELRSQIESERGSYLTREEYIIQHTALIDKLETAVRPLNEFMSQQRGRSSGIGASSNAVYLALILAVSIITVVILYGHHTITPPAVTVTVPTGRT